MTEPGLVEWLFPQSLPLTAADNVGALLPFMGVLVWFATIGEIERWAEKWGWFSFRTGVVFTHKTSKFSRQRCNLELKFIAMHYICMYVETLNLCNVRLLMHTFTIRNAIGNFFGRYMRGHCMLGRYGWGLKKLFAFKSCSCWHTVCQTVGCTTGIWWRLKTTQHW